MTVLPVTDPIPGLSSSRQNSPARVVGTLPDPREPETDADHPATILHLQGHDGATILHVLDTAGRLHRTDGPAVVEVGARAVTSSWWVGGVSIDNAEGPPILVDDHLAAHEAHIYRSCLRKLEDALPTGFRVTSEGKVLAPASVAGAIDRDDIAYMWQWSVEDQDPLITLAVMTHAAAAPRRAVGRDTEATRPHTWTV